MSELLQNMSDDSNSKYDKISKKCSGIKGLRLNPKRFSVQRLRSKFVYLFGILRRWKNSYRNALRLLRRKLMQTRRKGRRGHRDLVGKDSYHVYSSSGPIRSMTHSNSFCSEAIADCLEFIKRNSVSIDDDTKPMLKHE